MEDAGWLVPAHYGDPTAEYRQALEHAVVFDASHRGKVEVTGADAVLFLHNLCTNDIKNLPRGSGCEAFLTTAAARVVAYLLVYHVAQVDGSSALWLDTAPGTAEKVVKHLDHHLISEHVDLTDRSQEFAQVHVAGPQAQTVVQQALKTDVSALGNLQHRTGDFGAIGTCQVRCCAPLGLPGYDIVCLRERGPELWHALASAGARPAGLQAWGVLRIEAGTPAYGTDIDDNRLVMEVGRTAQAISYSKGCYVGQEPVVMARDRGHVNRMLLGLKVAAADPIPQGTVLFREGKEVGLVTSSVVSPRFGAIALAYIRRGHQDPGTLLEINVAGSERTAEVVRLPFSA
jgi:folate-binding protein YgfZ